MLPSGTYNTKYEQELDFVRTRWQKFLLVALFISFLTIPTFFLPNARLVFLISVGVTILTMTGKNVMMGYTGVISVAVMAFMAMGGYTAAILSEKFNFPFLAGVLAGGLVAGILNVILSLPTLRVRGFGVAGASLAIHYLTVWVINHGGSLTGERYGRGFSYPTYYPSIGGWVLDTEREYYVVTVVVVFLLLLALKNILRSHIGRAFIAIRDDQVAASVMGINIYAYKALSLFLGAFYAGIGGALWANYTMRLHPDNYLLWDAIWYMGFLVVGGVGTMVGPIFGSFAWKGLWFGILGLIPAVTQYFPGVSVNFFPNTAFLVNGLVILVFLLFVQRGLNYQWGVFKTFYRLWPFSY